MEEHHFSARRTARYYTLGVPASARELWVVLHGYGQLARYFLRPFAGLESDKLIAAPEALSRFYTDVGHSRVGATWMTREDRDHEIADQIAYLDGLATLLLATCAPLAKVCVLGFSQGAATASRWSIHGKTAISRIVLWGGTIPPELDPSTMAQRWGATPVALVHGERDRFVSSEEHSRDEARLRVAGVTLTSIRYEGTHALDNLTLRGILSE